MAQPIVYADAEDVEDRLAWLVARFGIYFPDDAFSEAETLGDICDILWLRIRSDVSGGRCPTSVGYYRIKRLIERQAPGLVMTPGTRLAEIKGLVYADLQAALQSEGWSSPRRFPRAMTWLTALAAATTAAAITNAIVTGLFHDVAGLVWIGVFYATVILAHEHLFSTGLPSECDTLGELARQVSFENLRDLRAKGATGVNRTMIWRMLTGGIDTEGGAPTPSTRLRCS